MPYNYLNNLEIEDAVTEIEKELTDSSFCLGIENIPVSEAINRITAEAVIAKISSPHYDACAMDGIALFAALTNGATATTPVYLREDVDFKRVDTGDPLPEGCDAVVMIEDVIECEDGVVKLVCAATPWQNIRQIGEDICTGEMILPSNTRITPASAGAFIAGGVLYVKVKKRPVIGIIPTGDEIITPVENPQKGDILEFNSTIFSGIIKNWDCIPKVYPIVKDNLESIKKALLNASSECDIVIINAGSSAGREDYSSTAINETGKLIFHGVAIKPGKPAIFGIVNSRPIIGVPGYPVSGIIVMEQIVKPLVELILKTSVEEEHTAVAELTRRVVSSLKYKEYVRVKLGNVNGRLIATPLNRGAGVITSFVKADGIMTLPINSEGIEKGEKVEVTILKSMDEINNSVVIVGSHDPLIDVVSDLMRIYFPSEYISSAHVGSMGGIMAIKRKEAHTAGIHLLDEKTGEYNVKYINQYLKNEKIELIHCVKRIQGFMVQPGNPKKIKDVNDLIQEGIRFVNRQKGSGTRILLDYMLNSKNICKDRIYGYEREEFTHMSVAALVAAGDCDVGLGIYSAAKAYNLGFIPVCTEQYDFIVPESYLKINAVRHFFKILKTDEFKKRLNQMGGYIVS